LQRPGESGCAGGRRVLSDGWMGGPFSQRNHNRKRKEEPDTICTYIVPFLLDWLSLKNDVNVHTVSNKQKNIEKQYFVRILNTTEKKIKKTDVNVHTVSNKQSNK
jgi:hypothetical protein